jgi:putative membrane protein
MAMGAADLVPGVSGGTVAFIAGIYEELLDTIGALGWATVSSLFADGPLETWRRFNLGFLAALAGGIGLSIVLLAGILHHLLVEYPVLLWAFFFGLVAASVPLMLRDIPRKLWDVPTVGFLALGSTLAWWLTGLPPLMQGDHPLFLFAAGAIAICAMILPGISGAFILVLLGAYSAVIGALKSFDVVRILSFGTGALVGLLGFSKGLGWVFRSHRKWAVALLSGFLIGSLRKLWPWKENLRALFTHSDGRVEFLQCNVSPTAHEDPRVALALGCMVAGAILVAGLGALAPSSQDSMDPGQD